MHKVLNYGSALQAYALQHYISKLGYDAELIDYVFPNGSRKKQQTLKQKILSIIKKLLSGGFIKEHRFKKFYDNYYILSKKQYITPDELKKANLQYDIYMTGSDQVWNPIHIKNDFSFFFPFKIPNSSRKVSYAASISVSRLDDSLKPTFKKLLESYSSISVRESSGVVIIEDLLGRKAEHVCDPTLLLTKDEWSDLVKDREVPYEKPYILVYILSYAYNPYPEINNIIDIIQQKLGLHLIILDGRLKDFKRKNATVIKNAGPLEFINLVKNSSFIITTSFHGTAFALNFGVPFYSVIKDYSGVDDRMLDLLKKTQNEDKAILYTKVLNRDNEINMDINDIENFRKSSEQCLQKILNRVNSR